MPYFHNPVTAEVKEDKRTRQAGAASPPLTLQNSPETHPQIQLQTQRLAQSSAQLATVTI